MALRKCPDVASLTLVFGPFLFVGQHGEILVTKILVVDDEQSIRHLCAEVLGREGYEVVTTGEETGVLDRISLEQPSAVILDIRLEDCDGLNLLQDLRNAHPALPIILYTAYDSYREDVKAVAADCPRPTVI